MSVSDRIASPARCVFKGVRTLAGLLVLSPDGCRRSFAKDAQIARERSLGGEIGTIRPRAPTPD